LFIPKIKMPTEEDYKTVAKLYKDNKLELESGNFDELVYFLWSRKIKTPNFHYEQFVVDTMMLYANSGHYPYDDWKPFVNYDDKLVYRSFAELKEDTMAPLAHDQAVFIHLFDRLGVFDCEHTLSTNEKTKMFFVGAQKDLRKEMMTWNNMRLYALVEIIYDYCDNGLEYGLKNIKTGNLDLIDGEGFLCVDGEEVAKA
jgi:hypothetical protein